MSLTSKTSDIYEHEWDTVWSREGVLTSVVNAGRKIYNSFWLRHIQVYLRPDTRMLEVGSGTASLMLSVASRIREGIGLDISDEALRLGTELAQKNGVTNVFFKKGDCMNVPYENEFDFVWSQGLVEHFDHSVDIAREHLKATKPGGTVLISVPHSLSYFRVWYFLTRPRMLQRFWPWTEQKFFSKKELLALGQKITPRSRVFLIKPFFLGIVFLEMKK
jgi:SAM-dependent methyltransferase